MTAPDFGPRNGQAGLFVVLNLCVVLGVVGLAVNVGWGYFTKIQAQSAADSAALAAVGYAAANASPTSGVTCGNNYATCSTQSCTSSITSASDSLTAGCLYAKENGFVTGNGVTVSLTANSSTYNAGPPATITNPPPGTSGVAPTYWVQANITTSPLNSFGPLGAAFSRFTVNASSIAAVTYSSTGGCIYAMDPSAAGALTVSGSSTINTTCGVYVNSSASPSGSSTAALVLAGGAKINASTSHVAVNGSYYISGTSSVTSADPSPGVTHTASFTDPLLSQAYPTFTQSTIQTCSSTNYSYSSSTLKYLTAGTYCGDSSDYGISITNSGNVEFSNDGTKTFYINNGIHITGSATVKFDPGIYVINGSTAGSTGYPGPAFLVDHGAQVTGSGVTFFITGQYKNSSNVPYTIGYLSIAGGATVKLSAPTSGTYQGMLFMQDRSLPCFYPTGQSCNTPNTFANGTSNVLQGSLYFPKFPLVYSGASATGTYAALIGLTISLTGSADFLNDPTGAYTGLATTVRGIIQ